MSGVSSVTNKICVTGKHKPVTPLESFGGVVPIRLYPDTARSNELVVNTLGSGGGVQVDPDRTCLVRWDWGLSVWDVPTRFRSTPGVSSSSWKRTRSLTTLTRVTRGKSIESTCDRKIWEGDVGESRFTPATWTSISYWTANSFSSRVQGPVRTTQCRRRLVLWST